MFLWYGSEAKLASLVGRKGEREGGMGWSEGGGREKEREREGGREG